MALTRICEPNICAFLSFSRGVPIVLSSTHRTPRRRSTRDALPRRRSVSQDGYHLEKVLHSIHKSSSMKLSWFYSGGKPLSSISCLVFWWSDLIFVNRSLSTNTAAAATRGRGQQPPRGWLGLGLHVTQGQQPPHIARHSHHKKNS